MSETEHRIGLSREGCRTSWRFAKEVGMRAVRGSSSGSDGEEWAGINREWTGSE